MMLGISAHAQKLILPVPSDLPSKAQQKQIARKYGMFIHFGINTFHNEEWTDGSKPASSYAPVAIDAEQWIRTARDAGMKYVILITNITMGSVFGTVSIPITMWLLPETKPMW